MVDGRVTAAELARTIRQWNSGAGGTSANSKYVASVQGNPQSGVITITYRAAAVGLDPQANTLVLTPLVRRANNGTLRTLPQALAAADMGIMEWACASATHATATAQGLAPVQPGTLQPVYAPAACR